MPPKRPSDAAPATPKKFKPDSHPIPPIISSPKKTSSPWSSSEEKKFLEAIDKIVKSSLWAELRAMMELERGARMGLDHIGMLW